RTLSPDPTIEEEVFDRLYITLSTTKISKYITPSITYYQTIYSWGSEPTQDGTLFYAPVTSFFFPSPVRPSNPRPFNQRSEALGGYLEGRINTRFPITDCIDFNPYGIISVSFRDRTEPGGANPYGGHPLTGWNHVQAGAELPIQLLPRAAITHAAHLGGLSSIEGKAVRVAASERGSQTKWAPPDAYLYFVPFG